MQITVTVTGLDETEAKLVQLKGGLTNFTEAMATVGEELKRYFSNDVFLQRGGMYGQPWVPLKAATVKEKSRRGYASNVGMLVRDGTLKEGYHAVSDVNSVLVDNETSYWIYHQTGTGYKGFGGKGSGRGNNLPQRQLIGASPGVRSIISQIIRADITAKIEKAMGL